MLSDSSEKKTIEGLTCHSRNVRYVVIKSNNFRAGTALDEPIIFSVA